MTDALTRMLASRDWLMADGATGTNLFNMGLESGEPPEFWNTDRPDNIRKLYGAAVEAGSDIFLTNTFGGNASRLKLHGAQGRVRELNRVGAELGREIADKAGRSVVVAGSVGPTGDIFEPMGTLTHALAVEMFHEQAEGLKEGGADVLWIETISAPEEYRAAAEAAARAGMPWCGTMSGTERPLIAKGNAGIPKYHDGHIHYDGTPELMAEYAVLARDAGARIIGGCCGTMPEHLRAMREALETRPKGDRPTLETISAALGGFSSASDGTGDTSGDPKRERRGRRG